MPASKPPRTVALIGPAHPYRGGIAHFGEMVTATLRERGHTVHEITFTRQYPDLLFPGRTQLDEGSPPPDGPPAVRLIDSLNPLSWWQTVQLIREKQVDVALFQHWMPYFAPAFGSIARLLKEDVPSLALVHNALPHERRLGDGMLTKYFLRSCEGLVVMSDAVEDQLRYLSIQKPALNIAHPVYARFGQAPSREDARAKLGLPTDAPVLLFFGYVRRYKGLRTLIKALPSVLDELPEARLVVAGAFYESEEEYREMIAKTGLSEHVLLFPDYIPDSDVPDFFAAADVVVQPYKRATQSGVAQIAFHFDRPLITTDVGGLPEIVPHEEAGFVVPRNSPAALARSIIRFFEGGWSDRLREGIARQKDRHGPGPLADALETLINRFVS